MAKDHFAVHYGIYNYKGLSKSGAPVKGMIRADSLDRARFEIEGQGVGITDLKPRPGLLIPRSAQKKIDIADITMFFRQLATMIAAGIPLAQALEFVGTGLDSLKMTNLVMTIHFHVSSGNTFAESLEKFPEYFNDLICSLVKVGEASGTLDTLLDQISSYLERMASLKGRIKKAMYYPVVMLLVMITLAVLLLTFIVPKFQNMFASFGANLPGPTQVVINLSDGLQKYWWLILGILIIVSTSFIILKKRSFAFRRLLAKAAINMWLFGPLIRKAAIARIVRTLSITLGAGVTLVDSLECVARVAGNQMYSESIERMRNRIINGEQMYSAMRTDTLFPTMVSQMVNVGEKSGSLELILLKVANYYDEQVDTQVEGLSTLIEPIMLLLLGLVVGGFVVSMYLPIFKIGTLV